MIAAVARDPRNCRERPTLVAERRQQLPGEMLRFGGTAAVAAEQLAAGSEDLGELLAPLVHDRRGHMCVAGSDGQVVEVRADQLRTPCRWLTTMAFLRVAAWPDVPRGDP